MNSTESPKVQDFLTKNGHAQQDKKKDSSEGSTVHNKVFVCRNSTLTDMVQINHLQTLSNIFHVIVIFLFIGTLLYYKADPSKMQEDFDAMKENFKNFPITLVLWLLFNFYAFAYYEGFRLWVHVRSKFDSKTVDIFFSCLFVGSLSVLVIGTTIFMLRTEFGPILGCAIGSEQARLHMKTYSFIRECAPRVLRHKPEKDECQKQVLYPTRKHYWYFLYAPTFLYADSYPRTEKRNWKHFFACLSQLILFIVFMYCTMFRYRELFKDVGKRPFKKEVKVLVIFSSIIPTFAALFCINYVILHCWLNMASELLRFGDRLFYEDWWNGTTFGQKYRKWNVPVHEWFYTYVYKESQRLIGCTDEAARWLVFILTGIVHEYILMLMFRFLYPLFGFLYSGGGFLMVDVTKGKKGRKWNIFLWIFIIWTMKACTYHYTLEYYARLNCPKEESFFNYIIPRMLDPACQITES